MCGTSVAASSEINRLNLTRRRTCLIQTGLARCSAAGCGLKKSLYAIWRTLQSMPHEQCADSSTHPLAHLPRAGQSNPVANVSTSLETTRSDRLRRGQTTEPDA